jgi:hypothetical protein
MPVKDTGRSGGLSTQIELAARWLEQREELGHSSSTIATASWRAFLQQVATELEAARAPRTPTCFDITKRVRQPRAQES